MSFSQITHNGNTIALLTTQPNMGAGLGVRYSIATTLEEGLSGRESRRAVHEALRIEQTLTFVMEAAEADAFRLGLQALGTAYVGIPLWLDYLLGSEYAERLHTAQFLLRFSNSTLVAGDSVLVAGEYYAPLLVGRLKDKPKYAVLSEGVCEVTITVREDSPWAYRIAPRDTVSASTFPSIAPDWTDVMEQWTDEIDFQQIGDGRTSSVVGDEHAPKWGQEAGFTLGSRDEIRTLLGFFLAAKGRWGSFNAPLWFQPGADAPTVPHTTKCRFASDLLALNFESGECATLKVGLWQVPWEISGVVGETPAQPSRAFLYKFTYNLPTPVISRFTSYEKDLALGGDGTYATQNIEHDAVKTGLSLDASAVKVTTDRFSGNPLLAFIPFNAEARLLLEIRECDPSNTAGAVLIWSGEIFSAKSTGKRIEATAEQFGDLFERKFPRFLMQHDCNVTLFSTACGVVKATYAKSGTLTAASGTELTVTTAATDAANYFVRGEIWVGSGSTIERRMILASAPGVGVQTITIDRPLLQAASGQSVQFWPGCDGQYATCSSKFSNASRFRGHPFMPEDNPALKRANAPVDARKK